MNIIGINPLHNSTACLLMDGEIIASISEERLSGYKNEEGNPILSIKFLLEQYKLKAEDIDFLAVSIQNPTAYIHYREEKGGHQKKNTFVNLTLLFHITVRPIVDALMRKSRTFGKIYHVLYNMTYAPIMWTLLKSLVYKEFKGLGFEKEHIVFIDHHEAHAAAAYYNMPNYQRKEVLVFTADGEGDGLCATVSAVSNNNWKWISKTSTGNSIAQLYGGITKYLGMKINDHEYKVMGLAAYTNKKDIQIVVDKLKDLFWVNEKKLTFETLYHSYVFLRKEFLQSRLLGLRFDLIAGGLQTFIEETTLLWIKSAIKKTGIKRLALGGGLFLNVKLNKRICELAEVKEVFFMPSASDESTAIGAAQVLYSKLRKTNGSLPDIKQLTDLYLGPQFSNEEIKKELSKLSESDYKIRKIKKIEDKIVDLLICGKIVARFSGRMEWGARALGNRSILADPSNLRLIHFINKQVKSRDFWMPFACTILKERERDYVINPKKIPAPYMVLALDTTDKAQKELVAGIHQYDFTIRPQILKKDWNPTYYGLIKEFERRTGIGGVLNTSFNLHGFPIVCSPKDALFVFKNSGLEYLAIGNYLISKRNLLMNKKTLE